MQALRIHGKLDMRLEEVDTPEPTVDQIRVRISYVGICGSDLHYYFEGANGPFVVEEPLIPGHELSGVIDLDPKGEFPIGSRVTVHPATFGKSSPEIIDSPNLWPQGKYLGSASTHPHTQGAASEFLIVERSMIRMLPDGLSLESAALAEPLAVGLHAINLAGGVAKKKILISGSGPIGILVASAAKVLGATEIVCTDLLDGPLKRAQELGATKVIKIGVDEIPQDYFDIVFECSGVARAISSAIAATRRAGKIIQVGMLSSGDHPITIAPLISKEISLQGTFRFNTEIDDAIAMLAINPWISKAISHNFPITEALEAFAMAKDSERSGKVLLAL
jgi:L-idonate 5-dehydrogenase